MKASALRLPTNMDHKKLVGLQRRFVTESNARLKKRRKAYFDHCSILEKAAIATGKSLSIDPKPLEQILRRSHKALQSVAGGREKFRPLTGHNPVRYAPFDWPYDSVIGGGVSGLSLYGTSALNGHAGANMGGVIGGHESAVTGVGFFYYAQQSGNLFVDAQVNFTGKGEVQAVFGYANASAIVTVDVAQYDPWQFWTATNEIYNRSAYVVEFDYRDWDWTTKGTSLIVPIRAGGLYAIACNLHQDIYIGGLYALAVSNFEAYLGPFHTDVS
jgi:hypothetical protein